MSRNGRDHTRRFADLAAAIGKLSPRTLVLDGEVAIYDQQLRSRFEWLLEPDPAAVVSPPVYAAFDIMFRDRIDLAGLPLSARRIHLEDVVAGADLVLPVRRLVRNGLDAWAQVVGNGYEGLVAKDEASMYEGGTTRPWMTQDSTTDDVLQVIDRVFARLSSFIPRRPSSFIPRLHPWTLPPRSTGGLSGSHIMLHDRPQHRTARGQ